MDVNDRNCVEQAQKDGERVGANGFTLNTDLHTAVEHATGEVFNDPISPKILEALYRGGWMVWRRR